MPYIPITAPRSKRVIFNPPATICIWPDGTKTVVKCHEGDTYSRKTGLLMCIAKKAYGNGGRWYDVLRDNDAFEDEEPTHEKEAPFVLDHYGNYVRVGDKVSRFWIDNVERCTVSEVHAGENTLAILGIDGLYDARGYVRMGGERHE